MHPEMTKGEAILFGLEQIREGLQMISKASKVISDFMGVLFELSKPFDQPEIIDVNPSERGTRS